MKLIDQHTKKIMEECKLRARDAGLQFEDESLEYIVTNRDMLELSPKVMIPTLYDYWVNDIEVLKKKGMYKVYPSNPYETVINSRPAISFYNDNNPDWLNIMIFYHVIGHIDCFQNNTFFQLSWNDDFVGQALADKRLLESYRSEHGRWVDYIIEFSRSIDNLNSYYSILSISNAPKNENPTSLASFYFDIFLQEIEKKSIHEIYKEVESYNQFQENNADIGESLFFSEVKKKYPEFEASFNKYNNINNHIKKDVIQFIRDKSPFLQKEANNWMKSVINIVRNTALYFEPQIRTKILNEGWASYWHDALFQKDERIKGHEVSYARINAYVTSINRVGLNPYAIGLRLMQYIEELGDKGKMSIHFQNQQNMYKREEFDKKEQKGKEAIFNIRSHFNDFSMINTFVDQDFVDKHNLFVTGKRLNQERRVWEYYVKSRKAEDYKQMLIDSLYHPPKINVNTEKTTDDFIYLEHEFEGKGLYKDFIPETLLGIAYLWGGEAKLETTEVIMKSPKTPQQKPEKIIKRVLYEVKNKHVTRREIS